MPGDEKILVIGGSGFLGSHLADTLSDAGYRVLVMDRKPSPHLRPGQEMLVGDVLDRAVLEKAVAGSRYVYHLAGVADIEEAAHDPRETVEQNVMGSVNVAEACIAQKVEKLLYASTVYVYSNKGSFYRVSKQAAELLLENYQRETGLNYTILRYGSLYGPRAQDWNGLKRFVVQAVRNGRIVYPGTGEERREYIHVKDAAQLSMEAMADEYHNQCLTITGPQVMTTREVLGMITEIMGNGVEVTFEPSGAGFSLFHYSSTPYRYNPKSGSKVMPRRFIDLGQGILDMIEEIHHGAGEEAPSQK